MRRWKKISILTLSLCLKTPYRQGKDEATILRMKEQLIFRAYDNGKIVTSVKNQQMIKKYVAFCCDRTAPEIE